MNEEDCGLCVFPNLRVNSNDCGVVDWFSKVISSRNGLLSISSYLKDARTFKTVHLSLQDDFFITPALVCCQINSSSVTKVKFNHKEISCTYIFDMGQVMVHRILGDGMSKDSLYACNTESRCTV